MSRIVVMLEPTENRRLLVDWLALHHDVVLAGSPADVDGAFDLGMVDGPSLERYGRWIDGVRRAVKPLFLPFLLITSRHGVAAATGQAWALVDDLIVTPVEKLELRARVDTLLRSRALSLANASLGQRLELELARAHEVQAGLLPHEAPELRDFDLAARCVPAREVSGDFFDWQLVHDAAVLSVGDVMGKGVPAALLAATARAVLRAVARDSSPGAALDSLNETLAGDLERASSFVTLFHARLAVGPHEVRYVDAGHGHALVRRANGAVERLACGGRPIGFPAAAAYRESTLHLDAGDLLFVYSDGLIEGSDQPPERLFDGLEAGGAAAGIVDQLIDRAPTRGAVDDVTALVLKCTAA